MGISKAIYTEKRNKKKKPPFGAIEVKTVESEEWERLNSTEAHIYNTLKTFYWKEKKVFLASFSGIKKRSRIKHGYTIEKALKGLEKEGWIEVKRYAKHGKKRGLRVRPNEYSLTFRFDRMRR